MVFLRRRGRRYLDPPRAGHDVARVARREPFQIFAPERLPHVPQVRGVGERPALEGRRWPVAAAAPRPALLVAGAPELLPGPAAGQDLGLLGQQRVHPQPALAILEREHGALDLRRVHPVQ